MINVSVGYEPKILGFLCNWCSYAGADLAGVSRFEYPPNARVIRVMCSGRVDPVHILEGFKSGADGVLVTGCHPGDCHYVSGNFSTERRVEIMKKVVNKIGIDPERIRLEWVSASEGRKYAELVKEYTDSIRKLGPFPLNEISDLLDAAIGAFGSERVRWLMNKQLEEIEPEKAENVIITSIEREIERYQLFQILEKGNSTVSEMAKQTNLPSDVIVQHLIALMKQGTAAITAEAEHEYIYTLSR